MTKVTLPQPEVIPPEVMEFAVQERVEDLVAPLMEVAKRVFPSRRRLEVYVDEDPEIADDRHIVFAVEALGLTPADAVTAQHRWIDELFSICPAPLSCVFRLSMHLVDS